MMTAAATNTAWAGPWGVSFTANLTPDEDTGIGAWSEDIFIATLRTGKHWGQSRQILPPMPWFNYGKMSDDDLKAVYAYLRSIPPVKNRVPTPLPPGRRAGGEERMGLESGAHATFRRRSSRLLRDPRAVGRRRDGRGLPVSRLEARA